MSLLAATLPGLATSPSIWFNGASPAPTTSVSPVGAPNVMAPLPAAPGASSTSVPVTWVPPVYWLAAARVTVPVVTTDPVPVPRWVPV